MNEIEIAFDGSRYVMMVEPLDGGWHIDIYRHYGCFVGSGNHDGDRFVTASGDVARFERLIAERIECGDFIQVA